MKVVKQIKYDFVRGNKVNYLGSNQESDCFPYNRGQSFAPLKDTFIWHVFDKDIAIYIIQHPQGFVKEYFLTAYGFTDELVEPLEEGLKGGTKKYIYACPEEIEKTVNVK